jgi:hypothetical protein
MSTDYGDYEPADVWCQKTRRARVEHWCSACDDVIQRGHLYVIDTVIGDGSVQSVKRCARCEMIYKHLRGLKWARETGPDWRLDCGHTYEEVWKTAPPPEIAELAFLTPEEAQRRFKP